MSAEAGRFQLDGRSLPYEPGDMVATTERWFHAAGCRRWLTLRRNTATDRVVA